jgi:TonB family protein
MDFGSLEMTPARWAVAALLAAAACGRGASPAPRPRVAAVDVPAPVETQPASELDAAVPVDASPAEDEPEAEALEGGPGMVGLRLGSDAGVGFGLLSPSGGRDMSSGVGTSSSVRTGRTFVVGSLPPELIRRVVQRHLSRIRYCYQRALGKDPKLEARVTPRFVIDASGHVASVSLTPGSGDAELDACILSAIRAMTFPPFDGGIVSVTYPFVLRNAP